MLASNVIGMPVNSIRIGGKLAEITGLLIDPNKLSVVAFWVKNPTMKEDHLLLYEDMREFNVRGAIIDDSHNISSPDELTRLQETLEINYQIPGKKVVGSRGKLGVATNFSFDPKTAEVMTIIGKPSLTRRFNQNEFTVHRRQIEEINDELIRINNGPAAVKAAGKKLARNAPIAD